MRGFRWAKRGEKCPKEYVERYVYRDSDHATHRSRAFVRRAKDARTGEYIDKRKGKKK